MGTWPWEGREYVKQGDPVALTYMSLEHAAEVCMRVTNMEQSAGLWGTEVRRLRTLKEENRNLRQLVAHLIPDKKMLQDVFWKTCEPAVTRVLVREVRVS